MNDMTPPRQLSSAAQPISPAKFAHFVLRTGQFDKMAEWYQTVLAARVVFRDKMLCFLSYDDEHHRLALINIPGLPVRDPNAVGTDHVAYAYNNLGELLSTYRRLKAAGLVPHWPINHSVTTSMYYRDPDNNRVELQIDNFATPAELDGYFHSRAFAENPVGVTTTRKSCAAATRPARQWPICSASRHCPQARPPGTCWPATDRLFNAARAVEAARNAHPEKKAGRRALRELRA